MRRDFFLSEQGSASSLDCPAGLVLGYGTTGNKSPIALPWAGDGEVLLHAHHLPRRAWMDSSAWTHCLHSLFKNKTFFALEPNSLVLPEWHWAGGPGLVHNSICKECGQGMVGETLGSTYRSEPTACSTVSAWPSKYSFANHLLFHLHFSAFLPFQISNY